MYYFRTHTKEDLPGWTEGTGKDGQDCSKGTTVWIETDRYRDPTVLIRSAFVLIGYLLFLAVTTRGDLTH